jgi:hypothetical protein
MASPCILCKSESDDTCGAPFFHMVTCTKKGCPNEKIRTFYVQWEEANNPVKVRAKAQHDLIRKLIRAWKPNMTRKQLNDVLYGLSEEGKDLLYP